MALTLSPDVRAALAARLPTDVAVDDLRISAVEYQVIPDSALDEAERLSVATVVEEVRQAGPAMLNSEGKPTIMKIVAWMAHAGVVNGNGDAFVAEELKTQADTLFRAPNFGVMDWNHAAVAPWRDAPPLIGVWYKADWAFDQAADGGRGAWGLLVSGIMFAWLFPEQADSLLAEQARSGKIKGSMACLASSIEFGEINGQRAAILHNPRFFTHSLLDVPPADPDALGHASEDPTVADTDLKAQLLGLATAAQAGSSTTGFQASSTATATIHGTTGTVTLWQPTTWTDITTAGHWTFSPNLILSGSTSITPAEDTHMTAEELLAQLQAEKAAADATVAELANKNAEATTRTAELEQAQAALVTEVAERDARIATLETVAAEQATARDALATELATAQERITALETELAAATAQLAVIAEAEAKAAREVRLTARKHELPETYLAAHEKKDETLKTQIEALWADLDDNAWELKKAELAGGLPVKIGYAKRSATEGGALPVVTAAGEGDLKAELKSLRKRSQ
jgi:hypothetical protein